MLSNFDLMSASKKYNIKLGGVFSKDQLPSRLPLNAGYILNLQDSHDSGGRPLPGSHWVAMWLEKQSNKKPYACYFDSFAFGPSEQTKKFLNQFVPYDVNTTEIQSINTTVCGYYCLYFIWYMAQAKIKNPRVRFKKFVDQFNDTRQSANRAILMKKLESIRPVDD